MGPIARRDGGPQTEQTVYNLRFRAVRQWAFPLSYSNHPMMPIIQTYNLTKQYGAGDLAVEVLKGVNLSIDRGEFVALMGPSGSGKSTLMSIIGGIEPPSSGQVLLDGVDISTLDDDQRTLLRRRKIGFVFQAFNLIPTLTALENVALPMELDGLSRPQAKQRASLALDRVEMKHRENHIPSQLSGGEQQRVAIARAIAIEPMILLADEPTGNLDSRQSGRVTDLLRSLSLESQQTIVMVTHDSQVAKAAFRLVKFRDGNIEADTVVVDLGFSPSSISPAAISPASATPASPVPIVKESPTDAA